MGATREEILNLAAFWESRGDLAEAARLRKSADEQLASLSTSAFTWHGSTGVAEMSDLQLRGYPAELVIESARSGWSVVFRLDHREVDAEGDLLFTRYVPTRAIAGKTHVCVVIYND